MAWTFTTLTQSIKDWTDNSETTFVAEIPFFITNTEERIFKNVDLNFFRKNVSGSLTSGNKFVNKPSDYLSSFSLAFTDSSGNSNFLLQKDVNFLQEYTPAGTATTGSPKYYAPYDFENFIVAPTPNSNYTVELHYYYRPASISTVDSGVTWLGTNAADALLYGCLTEAYTFMKGEPDILKQYNDRFIEALTSLKVYGEAMEDTDSYRIGKPLVSRR
tara:strand:+ start:994 stop:1644 length:651 start_codon:yes stop_codon:yes gene_type:complete